MRVLRKSWILSWLVASACVHTMPVVVPEPALPGRGLARELSPDSQVVQALNRLTYGGRLGDIASVKAQGLDRWLIRQLTPENWPDQPGDSVYSRYPVVAMPIKTLVDESPSEAVFVRRRRKELGLAANAQYTLTSADSARFRAMTALGTQRVNQYFSAKLAHAVVTDHQLEELMVDFWENHFSVFRDKMPTRFTLLAYDRDVIRPHALGHFRDLLGAVVHSPAMLFYLDNYRSFADSTRTPLPTFRAIALAKSAADSSRIRSAVLRRHGGLNENFGRELLELHTLGVDGGYTQKDVVNVARAFTGWSVDGADEGGEFSFDPRMHDADEKTVLGTVLPAGRGAEDGEQVLDLLAEHPSTANFISRKLVKYLVSDDPPISLVRRAANVFLQTHGDIRQVVACIVSAPEFYERKAFRAKIKTPYQVVVSTYRVLGGVPDTAGRSLAYVSQLGAPLFGHLSPEGWPDGESEWINPGSLLRRINFAGDVAANRVPGIVLGRVFGSSTVAMSTEARIASIQSAVLLNEPSAATRFALAAAVQRGRVPTFTELLGIALASPDFQER